MCVVYIERRMLRKYFGICWIWLTWKHPTCRQNTNNSGITLNFKRHRMKDDGCYINLLKYLFKDVCIDACLEKYLDRAYKIQNK